MRRNAHQPRATPKFSFVVPIYDRTQYVKEAISSILEQDFEDYELLLVLDGSPAETRDVVSRYSGEPKIRIFSYPNAFGTANRARNKGILESKGEYIVFQDSDDISLPNRLSIYNKSIESIENTSVIFGLCKYFASGPVWSSNLTKIINKVSEYHPATYASLLRANIIPMSTTAVRKSDLLRFGGFRLDMKYQEDYELWLRLAYMGCRFESKNNEMSLYRLHQDNNEKNFMAERDKWRHLAISSHKNDFNDWGT